MERLQKVMAHAGVASRRKCEEMILQGRVTVNHQVVKHLGTKVSAKDQIEVDGVPIYKEHPVYFMLHKPKKVISAVSDDKGRMTVVDLFETVEQRIYPVGRLDYDTTGLLIVTNDGEFANLMMHPRSKIAKVYVAKVEGIPSKASLEHLSKGVVLDGKKTSRAKTKLLSMNKEKQTAVVELTIYEGWNHQVKRMFEAIGHPVLKLKRERFGSLTLGTLPMGHSRELSAHEIKELVQLAKNK